MTGGQNPMSKSRWVLWSAAISLAGIAAVYSSLRWGGRGEGTRDALLAAMPADASAVLFADFAELRPTRFAAELFQWAPRPAADAEYAQFRSEERRVGKECRSR